MDFQEVSSNIEFLNPVYIQLGEDATFGESAWAKCVNCAEFIFGIGEDYQIRSNQLDENLQVAIKLVPDDSCLRGVIQVISFIVVTVLVLPALFLIAVKYVHHSDGFLPGIGQVNIEKPGNHSKISVVNDENEQTETQGQLAVGRKTSSQTPSTSVSNKKAEELVKDMWLLRAALPVRIEKSWEDDFTILRKMMIDNETPLVLLTPKGGGIGIGFIVKVAHRDYTLEEDTFACVMWNDSVRGTWHLHRKLCEPLHLNSEDQSILLNFTGPDKPLHMTVAQAEEFSSITQQSFLKEDQQTSLAWLLYNLIKNRQTVKISEIHTFYTEKSIPNPKSNWEIRLATVDEIKVDTARRKAKEEAAQAKMESSIIDEFAKVPLLELSPVEEREGYLDVIHQAMMDQKLSIARFHNGSIAFLLDVAHTDLNNRPDNRPYKRSLETKDPIVLVLQKQKSLSGYDWLIHSKSSERIEVTYQLSEEQLKRENEFRENEGWDLISPERTVDYDLFGFLYGNHSLKLKSSDQILYFLSNSKQNDLMEKDQKSLAWIVCRLLYNASGHTISLSENPMGFGNRNVKDPSGYWNLSLHKHLDPSKDNS